MSKNRAMHGNGKRRMKTMRKSKTKCKGGWMDHDSETSEDYSLSSEALSEMSQVYSNDESDLDPRDLTYMLKDERRQPISAPLYPDNHI
jgi:outer membrane scaffolding protein for murein synthesis (MipA/OmpV family)